MADDIVLPIPNLALPQFHFTLTQSNLTHLHSNARQELIAGIEKDGMYRLSYSFHLQILIYLQKWHRITA